MFHTVRSSVFGIERTFLVSDRALIVIAADGRRVDVPFQEIREVRLQYAGTTSYRCVIVTDSKRFVLTNRHYVRYGGRETRDESYSRFLTRLHEKLRLYAPNIRFTQSPRLPVRMAAVMFVLLPVLYVICLAGFSHSLMSRVCVVFPVLLIAPCTLLGTILPLMQRVRSRSYSPRELPVEFLPVEFLPV